MQYHQSYSSINWKSAPQAEKLQPAFSPLQNAVLSRTGMWQLNLCTLRIWQSLVWTTQRDPNPEVLLAGRGERTFRKAFPTYHFLLCHATLPSQILLNTLHLTPYISSSYSPSLMARYFFLCFYSTTKTL